MRNGIRVRGCVCTEAAVAHRVLYAWLELASSRPCCRREALTRLVLL